VESSMPWPLLLSGALLQLIEDRGVLERDTSPMISSPLAIERSRRRIITPERSGGA